MLHWFNPSTTTGPVAPTITSLVAGSSIQLTIIGGENAQIAMKVPLDMTRVFQGTLLMCVLATDMLTRYRLRLTLWEAA